MTNTIIEKISQIKRENPQNLMARHFSGDYFNSLEASDQQKLLSIFASGIENPDSSMGAYAQEPKDYDRFSTALDPLIRDFHGIADGIEIAQKHDWPNAETANCNLAEIDPKLKDVSMRVRVARNAATYPLPGAMSKDQRVAFENEAVAAFEKLIKDEAFGGQYLSITPGSKYEISSDEYEKRVAAHQMFKDMSSDRYLNVAGISSDWPYGRGMYVSRDQDFLVWVGEEDHLRIMSMMSGGDLGALFGRLNSGLQTLSALLPPFATSPVYGNVTSCPTNLGAGMRASLHMKLPNLTKGGTDLAVVTAAAKDLGLAVRGAGGEHSAAGSDGLVDVSPSARLGVTEREIMQRLFDGAKALWALEIKA